MICHCTDCQNISSAPYRVSVPVRAENLHLDGSVSTYIKIGGSGRERSLGFCGVCGSAVYSTSVEADPEFFNLRWGLIQQRAELPPRSQGFCGSSLPWIGDVGEIPVQG